MTTRRNFLKKSGMGLASLAVNPAWATSSLFETPQQRVYTSKRPAPENRKFTSKAVEKTIASVKSKINDPKKQ